MGVLNITPDSFSDGGHFNSVESALAKAKQLIAEGASVVDVGGESTRPGAARLTPAQEQARVLPVIRELVLLPEIADGSVALSIDTLNASTASLAVAAGVSIVNDVAGGQADPQMLAAVAELMGNPSTNGKPISYVLGHWANFAEGAAAVQQTADIVASVVVELAASVASAEAAGVIRNQIVLDPGLGFGKDAAQNWQLLDGFDALAGLGMPILIGASRKRFITARVAELRGTDPADVTISERDDATAALSEKLWNRAVESQNAQQLWGFRVHNVQANFDSLRAAAALRFADSASDLQS
jgi:dihydropteroate synthase